MKARQAAAQTGTQSLHDCADICRQDGMSKEDARVCLKIAFCKMCVTLCGRLAANEGGVASYVDRICRQYTAKWGVQIAEMNFQTHSSKYYLCYLIIL